MAKKRLLRLTWLDDQGEPYHVADVGPKMARELLVRAGCYVLDFPGSSYGNPIDHLSYAEVARHNRGARARKSFTQSEQVKVVITLPSDNPDQKADFVEGSL